MRLIKVRGVSKLLRDMRRVERTTLKGLERRQKRAGLYIQRQSQKIVPWDTRTLQNSAATRTISFGTHSEVRIGYYGVYYAIFVHEDLNARHKPGRQAKFLTAIVQSPQHRSMVQKILAGKK